MVFDFHNLLIAFHKAAKGKRKQVSVAAFEAGLEYELLRLQEELVSQTYRPGAYRAFYIYDPKKRMISAAPFRDRVVHHALCNIIEPIFERTFIFDSYANRKGKGAHRAIERFQQYARRIPYVLKCDVRKFFPSIDHLILKKAIRGKVACPKTLWLIDTIIDHSNPQEPVMQYFPGDDLFTPCNRRRGLPIGNLTSQFWANVYLNSFDHFVKEKLRVPGYIRYVDDFVLLHPDKAWLHAARKEIEYFLGEKRLKIHKNKTQIYQTARGLPFLGFLVWPQYRVAAKFKVSAYRRKLNARLSSEGLNSREEIDGLEAGLNSWLGHIRFGHSQRQERRVEELLRKGQIRILKTPKNSWILTCLWNASK